MTFFKKHFLWGLWNGTPHICFVMEFVFYLEPVTIHIHAKLQKKSKLGKKK